MKTCINCPAKCKLNDNEEFGVIENNLCTKFGQEWLQQQYEKNKIIPIKHEYTELN